MRQEARWQSVLDPWPDLPRQFARTQRQHSRGKCRLWRGCGGRSADAAAAARTAPGRRRGQGPCQYNRKKAYSSINTDRQYQTFAARTCTASAPQSTFWSGAEALRLAVDDVPFSLNRSSSSTAPNFQLEGVEQATDDIRDEFLDVLVRRTGSRLHFVSARSSGQSVR